MNDLHRDTWLPFYGSRAATYEHKVRMFAKLFGGHASFLEHCGAIIDARPGETLLDMCCGTGALTSYLGQHIAPSGRVIGIDFSAPMIQQTGPRESELVHFLVMDARTLEFPDHYFHGVSIVLALHEMSRDVRYEVLRQIWRVLKPGGRIIVVDHAMSSKFILRGLQKVLFRLISAPEERTTFSDLETHGIENEMKDCGFAIQRPKTLFNADMFFMVRGIKCE